MSIRLLKKEEIVQRQNADRSKEIAEGLKISRRVDGLRELQAKEEQTLDKFRHKSLTIISKEIRDLTEKRDTLAGEIVSIHRELSNETTLTRKERLNLEDLKQTLEKREKELEEKSEETDLKEIDIALALQEAKDDAERQRTHKEEAQHLHRIAAQREEETKQALERAQIIENNTLCEKRDIEEGLRLRENAIASKEKEITLREKENIDTSKELAQEKIRLADQRATLERALERLRKNRLA